MTVLVCGSRDWEDHQIVDAVLSGIYANCGHASENSRPLTIVAGCARGADTLAEMWVMETESRRKQGQGPPVVFMGFPADWSQGRAAGPIRNQQMLEEGRPDVVIAFKNGFDRDMRKGGTEDMCRRAKGAGVPVYLVERL